MIKYKIYELIPKSKVRMHNMMTINVPNGYEQPTITDFKLRELKCSAYSEFEEFEYDNVPHAMKYIEEVKEDIAGKNLTILPVISINWLGEIES